MYIFLNNKPTIQSNLNFSSKAKSLSPAKIKKLKRNDTIIKMNTT